MEIKVTTPEIRWHHGPTGLNETLLSVDFLHRHHTYASNEFPRVMATGGADNEVKLWRVPDELTSDSGPSFIFSLTGHDRSVNCVRFSPDGTKLASASDDLSIVVWSKPENGPDDWRWDHIAALSDVSRILLACGHKGDITDLSWSPDSKYLVSTSVDNSCVVWDVKTGETVVRRKDHKQYAQGAAWDPLSEFLVTEGNDRTCRVYSLDGLDPISSDSSKKNAKKCTCVSSVKTRDMGVTNEGKNTRHRMFLDDTCPAFARRPTWTPDGSFLLTPTGRFQSSEHATPVNTVYAFARGNLSQPTLHLPGQKKPSIGVRCSPQMYENDGRSYFGMSKRSIFAVITFDAVLVYDTRQRHPVCTFSDLHYADLTDVSWSADGQMLAVSSIDGYMSFIQFPLHFFGPSIPPNVLAEENETKMTSMFSMPKSGGRKKATKTKEVESKKRVAKPKETKVVNTLQVKKKRKISPTLVDASAKE